MDELVCQTTVWFPSAVQDLLGLIKSLDSTFPYDKHAWRDFAKTRWQAKNHDEDDDDDGPLAQRVRQSADASSNARQKAVEPEMADGDPSHAEGTHEEGLGAFPEPQGEDDPFKDYFVGVDEDTDREAPIALEEAERLQKHVRKLYDRAFSKLQDELSCHEVELEKLTSELNESKASSARKEEELNELRSSLEGVHQERTDFAEQDEVAAKDTEILELKRQNEAVTSEKDLLWGELASTQDLLRISQKEATALSVAKSEADEYVSSYKRDAATANDRVREISEKAEQKLAPAIAHARLQVRRQAFEEASATGVNLSAEIEKSRALEEESAPSTTSDEGSGSDSDGSEGSSALGLRHDNKWKESSKDEGADSEASPARRLKEDVSVEPAAPEASSLGKIVPPLSPSSFPVKGTSRDKDFLPPSSSPVEGTSRVVRGQGLPKGGGVSDDHVPSRDDSNGDDEVRPVDARSTFEEAQRLCCERRLTSSSPSCYAVKPRCGKPRMGEKSLRLLCDKRSTELILLRYEMNRSQNYEGHLERQLQRTTEDLELLWGEVGQAKYECNELRSQIDAQVAAKKNALAKAFSSRCDSEMLVKTGRSR
ncbi:uncharacterized protein [Nicotiana sylvestris]|uniref:uncharacterized protein n=1 Tax=Nicotiana sylvestris TaxID=4096 RepID=UPI00388C3AF9